jgi:hypothetical protein
MTLQKLNRLVLLITGSGEDDGEMGRVVINNLNSKL